MSSPVSALSSVDIPSSPSKRDVPIPFLERTRANSSPSAKRLPYVATRVPGISAKLENSPKEENQTHPIDETILTSAHQNSPSDPYTSSPVTAARTRYGTEGQTTACSHSYSASTDNIMSQPRNPKIRSALASRIGHRRMTIMSPTFQDGASSLEQGQIYSRAIASMCSNNGPFSNHLDDSIRRTRLIPHCAVRYEALPGCKQLEWSDIPSPCTGDTRGKVQLVYTQVAPPKGTGTDEATTYSQNSSTASANDEEASTPPSHVRLNEVTTCLWRQLFAAIQWERPEEAPHFTAPPGQLVFILAKAEHAHKILQQHTRFVLRQLASDGQTLQSWFYQDPVWRPHRPEVLSIGIAGVPYGYPAPMLHDKLPSDWYRWGRVSSIWTLQAQYPEWNVRDGHTGLAVMALEYIGSSVGIGESTTSRGVSPRGSQTAPPEVWNQELERLVKELPHHKATYHYPHTWSPRFFCLDRAWEQEINWFR